MIAEDYQENYKTGWIALYRSLMSHWIWNKDKMLKWWITMLFEVNHSDNKFILGYEVFDIKRGQSANSLRTWANIFNCSTKTVSKFFNLLEKEKMISVKIIGKGKQSTTLITIDLYDEYQKKVNATDYAKETKGKRKRDTNNNVNNVNNDIDSRKLKFASTLQPFLPKYGKDLLNNFYRYWTEPNKSNTKFRQELEKTWDLERRLETWVNNEKEFNKTKSTPTVLTGIV